MWLLKRCTRVREAIMSSGIFFISASAGFLDLFGLKLATGDHFRARMERSEAAERCRFTATEVDVPNESREVFPGAYAQVQLSTEGRNPSLLVPANTLVFRSEGAAVGVVKQDNTVELKKIRIGRDLGTKLEITQGLNAEEYQFSGAERMERSIIVSKNELLLSAW